MSTNFIYSPFIFSSPPRVGSSWTCKGTAVFCSECILCLSYRDADSIAPSYQSIAADEETDIHLYGALG